MICNHESLFVSFFVIKSILWFHEYQCLVWYNASWRYIKPSFVRAFILTHLFYIPCKTSS